MSENLIYRISLELDTHSGTVDSNTQTVNMIYQNGVEPVINEVIEKYGEKWNLIIDKLDIDLGDVQEYEVGTVLRSRLTSKLEELISRASSSDILANHDSTSLGSVKNHSELLLSDDIEGILNKYFFYESIPWFAGERDVVIADLLNNLGGADFALTSTKLGNLLKNSLKTFFRVIEFANPDMIIRAMRESPTNVSIWGQEHHKVSGHVFNGEGDRPETNTWNDNTDMDLLNILDSINLDAGLIDIMTTSDSSVESIAEKCTTYLNQCDALQSNLVSFVKRLSFEEMTSLIEFIRDRIPSDGLHEEIRNGEKELNKFELKATAERLFHLRKMIVELIAAIAYGYSKWREQEIKSVRDSIKEYSDTLFSINGNDLNAEYSDYKDFFEKNINKLNERIGVQIEKIEHRIYDIKNGLLAEADEDGVIIEITGKRDSRIHIDDAGIILMHPFLVNFFSNVGLYDKDSAAFINLKAQERGVHLLKYLTGYRGVHESHVLLLEKVICGLPFDYPMSKKFEISDAEIQEVESLLSVIGQYWTPLQGTSIEGLQSTFFQRNGSVEYSDNAWIIRVETSAVDILLNDLPWAISTIILPWQKDMILVEWEYETY